jgi:hypothetical protein
LRERATKEALVGRTASQMLPRTHPRTKPVALDLAAAALAFVL